MIEDNVPLSPKLMRLFSYGETKENVDLEMMRLEEYIYAYNEILPPKITPSYDVKYEQFQITKSDPVGNYVESRLDKLEMVNDFYSKLSEVLKKLTREELIYFTDTYFKFLKENVIEEKLHKTSGGLKYIKHSCIIKVALHLGIAVKITEK